MDEWRRKATGAGARPEQARTIVVPNRLDALTAIYEELEDFARDASLPDRTRRRLLLVIEELFSNTVRYGYDGNVPDSIVIAVERRGDEIRLVIRDHARPFDAAARPKAPASSEGPTDMPVGGLGLFLVHQFARSLTARRDGDGNITELLLTIDAN